MISTYKKLKDELMKAMIFGPPGSGKGTYAAIVSEEVGAIHVSTGILVREEQAKDTELGRKMKELTDKGELVDDKTITEILKSKLNESDCKERGFILDGYPRNLDQANILDGITSIDVVIYLNIPDEILIERLTSRRECKECHDTYNLKFNPSKVLGKCDRCGGDLYQRSDDKKEPVKNRLRVYKEQSEPVLNHYRGKVPFVDFVPEDPYAPPEVNAEAIIAELRKRGFIKQ